MATATTLKTPSTKDDKKAPHRNDGNNGKTASTPNKERIATQVADRIIELLDSGELPPWDKGWHNSSAGQPRNATSNRTYRGINLWLTLIAQRMGGYEDPRWLTLKQANSLGGSIVKGEQGTEIHLHKPWVPKSAKKTDAFQEPLDTDTENRPPEPEKPKRQRLWVWRTYRVFNVEQTTGCNIAPLEIDLEDRSHDPLEEAEAIISAMPNPPRIRYYQMRNHPPHYIPAKDLVEVPTKERYDRIEDWYNTTFHELVHSTGHTSRLSRFQDNVPAQDMHNYGREELVAGMGSAMLGELAGTGHLVIERDASYIKHWRDAIAADKSIVLDAATLAQKAVDYISPSFQPENSSTAST